MGNLLEVGDVGFGSFPWSTPEELRDRGLYDELATPVYDGEHGRVSERLLLRAIGAATSPATIPAES